MHSPFLKTRKRGGGKKKAVGKRKETEESRHERIIRVISQVNDLDLEKPSTIAKMSTKHVDIYMNIAHDLSQKRETATHSIRRLIVRSNDHFDDNKLFFLIRSMLCFAGVVRLLKKMNECTNGGGGKDAKGDESEYTLRSCAKQCPYFSSDGFVQSLKRFGMLGVDAAFVGRLEDAEEKMARHFHFGDKESARREVDRVANLYLASTCRTYVRKGSEEAARIEDICARIESLYRRTSTADDGNTSHEEKSTVLDSISFWFNVVASFCDPAGNSNEQKEEVCAARKSPKDTEGGLMRIAEGRLEQRFSEKEKARFRWKA